MTRDAVDRLRLDLRTQTAVLDTVDDIGEFAQRIAALLDRLDQGLAALLSADDSAPSTPEEALYQRAVRDFAALQSQLATVRTALSDKPLMLNVIRQSGHDVESTRQHLVLVGAMDQALQHVVHLMQYDATHRVEIDVRQGFQLSSGSVNYGRFYFGPPKENSGG